MTYNAIGRILAARLRSSCSERAGCSGECESRDDEYHAGDGFQLGIGEAPRLAELKSEFDPRDPTARAERVRIEDVLRSTELAIDKGPRDRTLEEAVRNWSARRPSNPTRPG